MYGAIQSGTVVIALVGMTLGTWTAVWRNLDKLPDRLWCHARPIIQGWSIGVTAAIAAVVVVIGLLARHPWWTESVSGLIGMAVLVGEATAGLLAALVSTAMRMGAIIAELVQPEYSECPGCENGTRRCEHGRRRTCRCRLSDGKRCDGGDTCGTCDGYGRGKRVTP